MMNFPRFLSDPKGVIPLLGKGSLPSPPQWGICRDSDKIVTQQCNYSRRCERQFRSKDEIIEVKDIPTKDHTVGVWNIFTVFAQMVCQPFELIDRLKDPLLYYLILFIRHQEVRKLGQLFSDLSSDHPMPSSSSVSRRYYINCFKISFYHPIPSALSVSSSCVNLVNCLKISHLIIPSHPVYPSSACSSAMYVNLVNCLNVSHLIIVGELCQ